MKKILIILLNLALIAGMLSLTVFAVLGIGCAISLLADFTPSGLRSMLWWLDGHDYILSLMGLFMIFVFALPSRSWSLLLRVPWKNILLALGMISGMVIAMLIILALWSLAADQKTDGFEMALWLWERPVLLVPMLGLSLFAGFYPTGCKDLIWRFGQWHFGH